VLEKISRSADFILETGISDDSPTTCTMMNTNLQLTQIHLLLMGKKPYYNKSLLLELVKQFKPTCAAHWRLIAQAYQQRTGEAELRRPSSLKRFFIEKMCNNMKKPTGGGNQVILDSQTAWLSIIEREGAISYGVASAGAGISSETAGGDGRGRVDDDDEDEEMAADFEHDNDDFQGAAAGPGVGPFNPPVASSFAGGDGVAAAASVAGGGATAAGRYEPPAKRVRVEAPETTSTKSKNSRPSGGSNPGYWKSHRRSRECCY
jgi:hypothetical protein